MDRSLWRTWLVKADKGRYRKSVPADIVSLESFGVTGGYCRIHSYVPFGDDDTDGLPCRNHVISRAALA